MVTWFVRMTCLFDICLASQTMTICSNLRTLIDFKSVLRAGPIGVVVVITSGRGAQNHGRHFLLSPYMDQRIDWAPHSLHKPANNVRAAVRGTAILHHRPWWKLPSRAFT